ncbi:hypothetical protein NKH57_14015 [Mesorhizobium sp. M1050]|uniref:hypothetical protein n=1 Tax=Mesorhizobium sp. M1050 TaxID=2957051 RepID=UPI003339BEF3
MATAHRRFYRMGPVRTSVRKRATEEHSANGYFDLGADAPDGGPMNAKETSDFSCRTALFNMPMISER